MALNIKIARLDPAAPSLQAEYARALDLDFLGKAVVKNFFVNLLEYSSHRVELLIGRYPFDLLDGHVTTAKGRTFSLEIKCARISTKKGTANTEPVWAYSNILHGKPNKSAVAKEKNYDLLIAIGLDLPVIDHKGYWTHLQGVGQNHQKQGRPGVELAYPHEAAFLCLCSIFLVPRHCIGTLDNSPRISAKSPEASRWGQYHCYGWDKERCQTVWENTLASLQT